MNSQKPILSLIIPYYNNPTDVVELVNKFKKIKETSDCNLNRFELIIVNDGSEKDLEPHLLREIKDKLEINHFTKNNGGVSSARNLGLANARGDYIIFLDSDDDVDCSVFDIIFNCLESDGNGSEVYLFSHEIVSLNGKKIKKGSELSGRYDTIDTLVSIFQKKTFFHICAFVYKKQFLIENQLYFDESLALSEDVLFILNSVSKAKNIYVSNDVYFRYKINEGSVINTDQGYNELNHLKAFRKIAELKIDVCLNKYLNFFLYTCVLNLLLRVALRSSINRKRKVKVMFKIIDYADNEIENFVLFELISLRSIVINFFRAMSKLMILKPIFWLCGFK